MKRAALLLSTLFLTAFAGAAWADEGGLSVWLPGQYGSLAAVPGAPGWSIGTVYYHTEVSTGANAAFARGGRIDLGIKGRGDLVVFSPTYGFHDPLWGGHLAVGVAVYGGKDKASVDASLTGPNGNTISGSRTQSIFTVGDLFPQISLAWNAGTSNYMTYISGDIPVGGFDPNRLVNLGLGHGAVDLGGAYTYFNPAEGNEISVTTGFTLNFENSTTNYRNGADWHIDWGASHFFSKQLLIGPVGYFYQQISGDTGTGATLGDFESRVAGAGGQIGYFLPVGDMKGYLNLKAYGEFAAQNRPSGWNLWLTFAVTPTG